MSTCSYCALIDPSHASLSPSLHHITLKSLPFLPSTVYTCTRSTRTLHVYNNVAWSGQPRGSSHKHYAYGLVTLSTWGRPYCTGPIGGVGLLHPFFLLPLPSSSPSSSPLLVLGWDKVMRGLDQALDAGIPSVKV